MWDQPGYEASGSLVLLSYPRPRYEAKLVKQHPHLVLAEFLSPLSTPQNTLSESDHWRLLSYSTVVYCKFAQCLCDEDREVTQNWQLTEGWYLVSAVMSEGKKSAVAGNQDQAPWFELPVVYHLAMICQAALQFKPGALEMIVELLFYCHRYPDLLWPTLSYSGTFIHILLYSQPYSALLCHILLYSSKFSILNHTLPIFCYIVNHT